MKNTSKLTEAFRQRETAELELLPSDEELAARYQFSSQFETKMEQLVRKVDHKYYLFRGFQIRKAAVAVLLLFLLVGAPMTVEAIRTPVVNFFVEIFSTFTRLQLAENDSALPETIEVIYHPEIPDGYQMTREVKATSFYKAIYMDQNDRMIRFEQLTLANLSITLDTEDTSLQPIKIHEYEGVYFINKGTTTLLWDNGAYGFIISGQGEIDEFVKIAESVKK